MKRSVLGFLFLLGVVFSVKSQIVVIDPAQVKVNKVGWARSIIQATKQCKQLEESKKIMLEGIEVYTKVSSSIQNAAAVKSIFDRQVKMISDIAKELKRTDAVNSEMFLTYCKRIEEIVLQNTAYIQLLKTTLSSYEKISQGERLKIILDLDDKTKEVVAKFGSERRRYNDYNRKVRILQNLSK